MLTWDVAAVGGAGLGGELGHGERVEAEGVGDDRRRAVFDVLAEGGAAGSGGETPRWVIYLASHSGRRGWPAPRPGNSQGEPGLVAVRMLVRLAT